MPEVCGSDPQHAWALPPRGGIPLTIANMSTILVRLMHMGYLCWNTTVEFHHG